MMVPIAQSVIDLVLRSQTGVGLREAGWIPPDRVAERNFAVGLLLCIAYAASIGGVATIIGSPPNGIAVRYIKQSFGKELTFFDWLLIGGPFTLVFLPIAWLLVTRVLFRTDIVEITGGTSTSRRSIESSAPHPGREDRAGRLRRHRAALDHQPALKGVAVGGVTPLAGLSDAGIAMLAALALFLIPVDRANNVRAMDWATAVKLPWGVLMLFGGGLTLATAIEANACRRSSATRLAASPSCRRSCSCS
jgi:sodium-dependent dicarboxylate transporter 2/3/5